jgi:Ni/Co efflux regulator RcnB
VFVLSLHVTSPTHLTQSEVFHVNQFSRLVALSTVSAVLFSGVSFAQDHHDDQQQDHHDQQQQYHQDDQHHDNHQYVQHREWRRGHRMNHDDWARGERVDDWHAHHLRHPPRGYEWREVDGNYVLAAVATGFIASVIAESMAH